MAGQRDGEPPAAREMVHREAGGGGLNGPRSPDFAEEIGRRDEHLDIRQLEYSIHREVGASLGGGAIKPAAEAGEAAERDQQGKHGPERDGFCRRNRRQPPTDTSVFGAPLYPYCKWENEE